jgi:hypothetical protein
VFERFAHTRGAFAALDFGEAQWEFDVLFQRHARQQVKRLETIPTVLRR